MVERSLSMREVPGSIPGASNPLLILYMMITFWSFSGYVIKVDKENTPSTLVWLSEVQNSRAKSEDGIMDLKRKIFVCCVK